jgi:hypothetical protein
MLRSYLEDNWRYSLKSDSKIWSWGLRPKKDYAGKTHPLVREDAPKSKTVTFNSNKYLAMSPRWGSTPRLTD